jgi:hypothetical protein
MWEASTSHKEQPMQHGSPTRRRIPRLTATVVLVAALVASIFTAATTSPAAAVPVDGLYTGTLDLSGVRSPISVTLSTTTGARGPVSATATIGAGVTISCFGDHSIATTLALTAPGGGVPSVAGPGDASFTLNGSFPVLGQTVGVRVDATVSSDRTRLTGPVTVSLPLGCGTRNLTLDARSDTPFHIRTGHDGQVVGGTDLTHMIDKEDPATAPATWERCMSLWADLPAGASVPPGTSWSIESGAPAGAHIRSGWQNGAPSSEPSDGTPAPLRTMVCITQDTPLDTTFTVQLANDSRVWGRILLWVGPFVDYVGRGQGDVHNTTFDQVHYDFQGVGEYVDAVAPATWKDFTVQSRLESVPGMPVTVTTAVSALVNGDRVALYLNNGKPEWYLDGSPLAVPAKLPSGGEITRPDEVHWRVTWPRTTLDPGATTGTTMQLSFNRWTPMDHLNIDELVLGPGLREGQVSGLFGIADRDASNDLTPSWGGAPVSPVIDPASPPFTQPLYRDFGKSWLVDSSGSPSGTLFDYLDKNHPDPGSYQNESYPENRPEVVDGKARTVCLKAGVTQRPQLDFCTYDIGVTGAREIAGYYADGWLPV